MSTTFVIGEIGINHNGDINICKKLNATKYIAGPLAHQYLDVNLFGDIEILYYKPQVPNYYSTLYNLFNS